MEKEELKTLFEICRKHQVYVISDEIHHDLIFSEHPHVPSLSVGEYADMMVAITAPSKTFNLAGGQNSIVIIPDDKLRKKWDTFVDGIRVRSGNSVWIYRSRGGIPDRSFLLESVKHRSVKMKHMSEKHLKKNFRM